MKPKQKVTTYRDFMASRGYLDSSRYLMPARPLLLPFEFNEEEEREISEAIAREEELMRIEEENKGGIGNYEGSGITSNFASRVYIPSDPIKQHPYVSNLLPSVNDTPDDKIIKQVLDVMFSQVCRWDKQYGWSKMHQKKARQKNDTEKIHMRKMRSNQRELLLNEHVEKLKKEINKRRTKLENEAEQQCGLLTPWRKSRARPQRSSKQPKAATLETTNVKKEVINPADITLGGDTFEYSKQETKPSLRIEEKTTTTQEESSQGSSSIASTVARRRRTSMNLSKSEDDEGQLTSRVKQRRLSESQPEKEEEGEDQEQRKRSEDEEDDDEDEVTEDVRQRMVEIDRNVLHCICQTFYDETKFYVMCDMCNGWFHGNCVGLTEKRAQKMDGWTCRQCLEEERRVKNSPQLYCLCRTPYDDTKFYVGCDSCQGWFHPECVKTTRELAEAAAEYICPLCKEAEEKGYESSSSEASVASHASSTVMLNRADYPHIMRLLELLMEHRMSSPFRKAVNTDEFPDYLQVVKTPIDLSIISKKVESLEYAYLKEFVADVNLMFENAKKYNPKDHAIFKCAETIQETFEERLIEVRDAIRINHYPRRRIDSIGNNTLDGSLDIDTDQLLSIDPNIDPNSIFHVYDI